jgi:hypothetical protein
MLSFQLLFKTIGSEDILETFNTNPSSINIEEVRTNELYSVIKYLDVNQISEHLLLHLDSRSPGKYLTNSDAIANKVYNNCSDCGNEFKETCASKLNFFAGTHLCEKCLLDRVDNIDRYNCDFKTVSHLYFMEYMKNLTHNSTNTKSHCSNSILYTLMHRKYSIASKHLKEYIDRDIPNIDQLKSCVSNTIGVIEQDLHGKNTLAAMCLIILAFQPVILHIMDLMIYKIQNILKNLGLPQIPLNKYWNTFSSIYSIYCALVMYENNH